MRKNRTAKLWSFKLNNQIGPFSQGQLKGHFTEETQQLLVVVRLHPASVSDKVVALGVWKKLETFFF